MAINFFYRRSLAQDDLIKLITSGLQSRPVTRACGCEVRRLGLRLGLELV